MLFLKRISLIVCRVRWLLLLRLWHLEVALARFLPLEGDGAGVGRMRVVGDLVLGRRLVDMVQIIDQSAVGERSVGGRHRKG